MGTATCQATPLCPQLPAFNLEILVLKRKRPRFARPHYLFLPSKYSIRNAQRISNIMIIQQIVIQTTGGKKNVSANFHTNGGSLYMVIVISLARNKLAKPKRKPKNINTIATANTSRCFILSPHSKVVSYDTIPNF